MEEERIQEASVTRPKICPFMKKNEKLSEKVAFKVTLTGGEILIRLEKTLREHKHLLCRTDMVSIFS